MFPRSGESGGSLAPTSGMSLTALSAGEHLGCVKVWDCRVGSFWIWGSRFRLSRCSQGVTVGLGFLDSS